MGLDWSRIDNYRIFQRLVNHLFALECNSPGFIPSSPCIGADGGWDGRYDGYYAPEKRSGKWSIEAKSTKHSLKDAMPHLKTQVKSALKKANKNGVKHLRVATNAELRVEQVRDLQKIPKGKVKTLVVWAREALTLRIERQPFLRHLFFGHPQVPKFVPSSHYFQNVEKHLLADNLDVKAFAPCFLKAKEVIVSPKLHVLVLHASGGLGKSHALRQISEFAYGEDPSRQTWLVKDGCRDIKDAFQDELIIDSRRYLFLLDDAERRPEQEIRDILVFAKGYGGQAKVILACRSAGQFMVERLLSDTRCNDISDTMRILPWDKDDLITLLRHSADRASVVNEEEIVAAYRNPYIISWIGQNLKGSTGDVDGLKTRLLSDMRRDACDTLAEITGLDASSLLTHIAAVVPFTEADTKIVGAIANACKVSSEKISRSLGLLVDGGILRTVGDKFRFDPDVKGDFWLAEVLKGSSVPETEDMFEIYLSLSGDRFLTNIEAAFRYCDSPVVQDRLSSLVSSWVQEAVSTDIPIRASRLGYLENLCGIVPEETLDLLTEYLCLEGIKTPKGSARRPDRSFRLSTDQYGPVVLRLIQMPKVRKDVLKLIVDIQTNALDGTYSNYHAASLLQGCVSPVTNAVPAILETLGVLAEWLQDLKAELVPLITVALTEILGEAHKRETSTSRAFSIGQVALQNTPQIRMMRDTAMSLLGQMLQHQSAEAQFAALHIAETHGRTPVGMPMQRPLPLKDKIVQERMALARKLGEQMIQTDNWRLRSAIEDLLLHWWASNSRGSVEARKYLLRLPRLPEYLAMRYFLSPDDIVEDFRSFSKSAPRAKRWEWYVDQTLSRAVTWKREQFQTIVEAFAQKYVSSGEVVEYIVALEGLILADDPWAHPPIVSQWVVLRKSVFKDIRSTKELWRKVPERFKIEVDAALASVYKNHVRTVANEILPCPKKFSIPQLRAFLRMVRKWRSKAELEEWLNTLVDDGNEQVRTCVAEQVFHIYESTKDGKAILRVLTRVLERQRGIGRLLDSVATAIHWSEPFMPKVPRGTVDRFRSVLFSKLRTVKNFDYRADNLLGFSSSSVSDACTFIAYRIRKYDRMLQKGTLGNYRAVPYHGLKSLQKLIQNYADFQYFMNWVLRGRGERYLSGHNDVEHIVSPLFKDQNAAPQFIDYMRRYVEQKVDENAVDEALVACTYIPFITENIDLMLTVAVAAQESGKIAEIKSMFASHLFPADGMTSGVGQAPPELVRRRGLFLDMTKRVGRGVLGSILREQAKWLDSNIERWQKHDEDILNPRA